MTASSCVLTTCIGKETPYRTSMVTVLYPFDGNMNDMSGYASGTAFGSTVASTTGFAYIGQALGLGSASQQFVQIPYVNFAQQSFTLQMWIYPLNTNTSAEVGIFGQCDSSSVCFALSLRNARVSVSFDSINSNVSPLVGTTLIIGTYWTHVSVVYDAVLRQQQIYVNGRIDAVSYGMVNAYSGSSSGSVTTIGRSAMVSSNFTYFDGSVKETFIFTCVTLIFRRIDHVTLSAGSARSACQVLNDASLTAYYPFDTVGTANDHSVSLTNGIASGTTLVSAGRIGQALSFPLTTSYFQAPCFTTMRTFNLAFTVAMWINPSVTTNGGSLVHVSTASSGGGTCYDLLVFTAGGALVTQYLPSTPPVVAILGPLIPVNVWTHVAVIFGQSNGVRLHINGQMVAASSNTGATGLRDYNSPIYITLGNISPFGPSASTTCSNGSLAIASGSYTGMIDDFRLYNREIDLQEMCVLVNPWRLYSYSSSIHQYFTTNLNKFFLCRMMIFPSSLNKAQCMIFTVAFIEHVLVIKR